MRKIYFLIDNIHPSLGGLSTSSKSICDLYSNVIDSEILFINKSIRHSYKLSTFKYFLNIRKVKKNPDNIFIVHGYFSINLFVLIFFSRIKLYCYTHGMLHQNALIHKKNSIFLKKLFVRIVNYFGKNVIFIALSEKESLHIELQHPKNKIIIIENALN